MWKKRRLFGNLLLWLVTVIHLKQCGHTYKTPEKWPNTWMSLSYKVNLLAEIITLIITLISVTPRYESCLSHQVGQELWAELVEPRHQRCWQLPWRQSLLLGQEWVSTWRNPAPHKQRDFQMRDSHHLAEICKQTVKQFSQKVLAFLGMLDYHVSVWCIWVTFHYSIHCCVISFVTFSYIFVDLEKKYFKCSKKCQNS